MAKFLVEIDELELILACEDEHGLCTHNRRHKTASKSITTKRLRKLLKRAKDQKGYTISNFKVTRQ